MNLKDIYVDEIGDWFNLEELYTEMGASNDEIIEFLGEGELFVSIDELLLEAYLYADDLSKEIVIKIASKNKEFFEDLRIMNDHLIEIRNLIDDLKEIRNS